MADFEESFVHELSMNRAMAMFKRNMNTMLAHQNGQSEKILHFIGQVNPLKSVFILLLTTS
jgi:hypothetical protein